MKRANLVYITLVLSLPSISFCGFYVAQAGASLFNQSSEVILVRNDNHTVVTMANDYQGDVQDFAMVIPVPEVLGREDIRIVDRDIFARFDAYSGPRLVEYWDGDPCYEEDLFLQDGMAMSAEETVEIDFEGVTIEAEYQVGEYNILILSATQSQGLKTWLTRNGYQIPEGANEVLDPYIKSDLKFFVVKVNLEELDKTGFDYLRPLQIEYDSEEFMLPIRLGMANANGDQDLIVYAFSKEGRIECANYQTIEIPSNLDIPEFVKDTFDAFYVDVFNKAYENNPEAVYLEYTWDLDSRNYLKCDPCSGQPPRFTDLQQAGVSWLVHNDEGQMRGNDYEGDLHFTRLHVRYNRENFPQDLMFQETPNKDSYQARYVMRHPFLGTDIDCMDGFSYLASLDGRRKEELENLASLTGWDISQNKEYAEEFESYTTMVQESKQNLWLRFGLYALGVLLIIFLGIRWIVKRRSR